MYASILTKIASEFWFNFHNKRAPLCLKRPKDVILEIGGDLSFEPPPIRQW